MKGIFGKVLWVGRAAVFAVGLALMLGVLLITANPVHAKTFTIRYFSNPPNGDEGAQFIGKKSVSTNANGNDTFTFSPAEMVPDGQTITATATNQ